MKSFWGICLGLLACVATVSGEEGSKVGSPAPNITVTDENGKSVNLADYKDKNGVVVFFYPKADTPGCTKQSCAFRDDVKEFTDKGYVVFGASRDDAKAQTLFKEKFKLNYPLLSDPKGELAAAFGFTPGKRQTAVIGKSGKIEKVYAVKDAAGNSKEVLKDLK